MNYLGHSFLSFGDAEILCGNMMGDFVKGSDALKQYPEGIRAGLMRHRYIDSFTDAHPAIAEAKEIFRDPYGLYAGPITDTLMDYFLATDGQLFATQEALWNYSMEVYTLLASQRQHFPERFLPYYDSMVQHNWLYHYHSHDGIQRALRGLKARAQHIEEVDTAFALFVDNKEKLRELYLSFISDIIAFVKIEFAGK